MGILGKKGKFAQKKERKGLWRGAVTGIAAIVVFCTTYALILPAITMETQGLSCGLAEHTHSQDCYQLICGKQEYFSHSHSDECYENGALVCTLTERTLHHHSEDCYSKPEPICGLTEGQGHTHAESCYTTERTLVCTQSECSPHTHSDGCYTEEAIPCTQEAVEGHTHGEDCYTDGERTCGKEETQGHTHSEACAQTKQVLTCTLAETQGHRHSDECYEEKQLLSCGQEAREAHTHSESCYPSDFQPTLICDQEDIPEHRHSQDCYARTCELEEHKHSELCVENHEAFLENQNEILKNDNEQTGSNENSSNEEAQNQGNSQEQASNNEEQNQQNFQEQTANNEEQNQQNSQEQSSNEQSQNQENSQEQASNEQSQNQQNSQQQASDNETQNHEESQNQPSEEKIENQEGSQDDPSDGKDGNFVDDDEAADVDWNDPEAAEDAGFILICDEEEQTHSHERDCYISIEEYLELYNGISTYGGIGETVVQQETSLDTYLTNISTAGTKYNPSTNDYDTSLTFNFTLPRIDGKFPAYDYTMQLKGVNVPDSLITKDGSPIQHGLLDIGKNPAGTYQFTKDDSGNYFVTVHMNVDYVDTKTSDIQGYITLNGSLDESTLQTDGSLKAEYRTDLTIDVQPDKIDFSSGLRDYDMSTNKTGYYNREDGTLVYTVTVSSIKGTPNPINYIDEMTPNGLPIDRTNMSVLVQKGTVDEWGNQTGSLTTIDNHGLTFSESDGKIISSSDNLAGLNKKECYVITYTYPLGTISDLDYDYSPTNTVTASAADGNQSVTKESSKNDIHITNAYTLSKGGSFDGESSINWTITVNSGNSNISGMHIQDGKLTSDNTTVKVEPDQGWQWDGDNILFTTPAEGSTENTNTYTITYSTPVTPGITTKKETNEAILKQGEDVIKTASSGEVPYTADYLKKELIGTTEPTASAPNLTMQWRVTITVPETGLPAGTIIKENTNYNGSSSHIIQKDSVQLKYSDESQTAVEGYVVKMWSDAWKMDDSYAEQDSGDQPYMSIVLPEIQYDQNKPEIILTYSTVSNPGIEGSYTFANTVSVGDMKKSIEYTSNFPIQASLTKTDGNDRTEDCEVDGDGNFTWKVKVKVGGDWNAKEITVNDTLPSNVLLDKSASGYLVILNPNNQQTTLTVDDTGTINKTENGFIYSGSYNSSTNLLNLMVKKEDNSEFAAGQVFTLTYKCIISEEYAASKDEGYNENFTNSVTVLYDGKTFNEAPVVHTQKWTKTVETPPEEKVLQKGGTWDSTFNLETYTVIINPKGEDLLSGVDTLEIEDTLEYVRGNFKADYYLVMSSVKLYWLNSDGTVGGTMPADQWRWTTSDNLDEISPDSQWEKIYKKLHVFVPDSKALKLEYTYHLEVKYNPGYGIDQASNSLQAKNTVTVNGVADSSSEHIPTEVSWVASGTQGGVVASGAWNFTKVDQNNNAIILGGAVFQVAQYEKAGDSWDWKDIDGKTYTAGNDPNNTDTFGRFTILSTDDYEKNRLYKIYETKAPSGYLLPQNPPEYLFYFGDSSETNNLPDDQAMVNRAINLSTYSVGNQLIPNEKDTTPSYTLPNTGGVGTEIYTAAGLAVSIGAVLGLMKKRKKGERE